MEDHLSDGGCTCQGWSGWTMRVLPGVRLSSSACVTTTNRSACTTDPFAHLAVTHGSHRHRHGHRLTTQCFRHLADPDLLSPQIY